MPRAVLVAVFLAALAIAACNIMPVATPTPGTSLPVPLEARPTATSTATRMANVAPPIRATPTSSSNAIASISGSVSTVSETVYYDIRGSTVEELWKEITRYGPRDAGGTYAGYTKWWVNWSYRYRSSAQACAMGAVQVEVKVTTTLPRLVQSPAVTPLLRQRWDSFLEALIVHENGHKEIGIATGHEVHRTLSSLQARRSCQELGAAANSEAERVVEEFRRREIAYDRSTRHGETQGAVLR